MVFGWQARKVTDLPLGLFPHESGEGGLGRRHGDGRVSRRQAGLALPAKLEEPVGLEMQGAGRSFHAL